MKRKTKRGTVMAALPMALFIFAGNMLTVGRGGAVTASELILSAALASAVLPVAAYAANAIFAEKKPCGALQKTALVIFSLAVSAAALYVAAVTVKEFSSFAAEVMFLRIPDVAVGVIFVAVCSYLGSCGGGTLKKFAFACAVFVSVTAVLLLALSLPNLKFERIYELISASKDLTVGGVLSVFSAVFAPAVLAVVYLSSEGGVRIRSPFYGVIISAVLLLICFLNVFLLLGGAFGAAQDYPYATAVSTVTAGKLFARMEGFAYMMYYAAGAVRVSLCISLVSVLAERLLRRRHRIFPYAVGAAVFTVTLLLSYS